MKPFLFTFLLCLTICQQFARADNGDILATKTTRSGRTVEQIEWSGTEKKHLLITYPKDLKPNQRYHLNFWFPGTGGNPSLGIADQNLDYIEICVSYLSQQNFQPGEWALKHWEFCREVEEHVVTQKDLTIGRRIVSGVSKGGWLAFEMSVEAPNGLDGVIIVAAGKSPREQRTINFKDSRLSVLVCIGETDSNYPFSQMTEAFYRGGGLQDYCYEEWLTRGHVSQISERVIEWLNVQAKKEDSPAALQAYCNQLIRRRLSEGQKLNSAIEHYLALRHHLKSPAAAHITDSLRQELIANGRQLAKDPAVASWLKDYKILRKIVMSDFKNYQKGTVTSGETARVKEHFLKLAQTTSQPDLKIRSAYGYLRKTKDEAMLLLQEKEKSTPAYQDLENNLKELRDTLNKQRPPDPQLAEQFHQLAAELGKLNNRVAMDSFRQVEWKDDFEFDEPLIETLLKEGRETLGGISPYTGVSF